ERLNPSGNMNGLALTDGEVRQLVRLVRHLVHLVRQRGRLISHAPLPPRPTSDPYSQTFGRQRLSPAEAAGHPASDCPATGEKDSTYDRFPVHIRHKSALPVLARC